MREIDFLPLALGRTARRRHRHLRTIVVAGIVAAVAVGVHVVHQARARSSQASVVRPVTPPATGSSHDNHNNGVQPKHHIHLMVPPASRLQGTPLDAVLAEACDLENDSLIIASAKTDCAAGTTEVAFHAATTTNPASSADYLSVPLPPAAGGVTTVHLNGFASTEIAIGMLLGRLSASPLVYDARLTDSREVQFNGRAMREFTITFAIRDGRCPR
jgi:hypothetical protein